MSLISFTPLQDGVTGVNAAGTNNPLNTIYNDYNGNITDANISASAAIAFSKIAGGTVSALTAFTSWSPAWVNWTIGNGTVIAKYLQIGKGVWCRLSVTWGSTTSITGGDPTFTLPVTAVSGFYIPFQPAPGTGGASIDGTGSGSAMLVVNIRSTTTASMHTLNVAGTYPNVTSISNSVPISHTTGSVDTCEFFFEAA